MSERFRARGNWSSGVAGHFVDVKALDIFVKILPWMLAVEAIVRGWEIMRITGMLLNFTPTPLQGDPGESAFGFEFFGFSMFLAGVVMILGLSFRRFLPIIFACLLGFASYLLLSVSYFVEGFIGTSGAGARGGITFLILAGLWLFKGFFAANKKSLHDLEKVADEQSRKVTGND